jgi:hypothetical protein
MTKDEALKLALEAMCVAVEPKKGKVYAREFEPIDCFAMHEQAITALREALAQPAQEPVGHLYTIAGVQHCTIERVLPDGPLYTSPPKPDLTDLTDADRKSYQAGHNAGVAHHKQATKRQPLEKREIMNALMSVDPETKRLAPGFEQFARAIEAKLKELNHE